MVNLKQRLSEGDISQFLRSTFWYISSNTLNIFFVDGVGASTDLSPCQSHVQWERSLLQSKSELEMQQLPLQHKLSYLTSSELLKEATKESFE